MSLGDVALLLLCAILAARPLISDAFERLEISFLTPFLDDSGPGSATSAVLDGLLLSCAAVVVALRLPQRVSVGAVFGIVLLLAAVVVSTLGAQSQRVALNAGAALVVVAIVVGALACGAAQRWMVRLLIAGMLASACCNAVKCLNQSWFEFEQTARNWHEQRKPELERLGADLDSPAIVDFERRLASQQATGFLFHPNVVAATMAAALLVGLGLLGATVLGGNRASGWTGVAVGLVVLLIAGLWPTGSLGALLATVLALPALVAGFVPTLRERPRRLFGLLAGGYVALIAIGATVGLVRGTLPTDSMAFRWNYWSAAVEAAPEVGWTGLGRENFIHAYMEHKRPESTEEVRNPHGLWVTLWAELGPLGLLAGVVLIAVLVWQATRALVRGAEPASGGSPVRPMAIGFGAVVLLVQLVASGMGGQITAAAADPGVMFLLLRHWLLGVAAVWGISAVLVYRLVEAVDARHLALVGAGLLAATFGTLVHNLVGISVFTPAGGAAFAGLAGALLARGAQGGGWNASKGAVAGAAPAWMRGVVVGGLGLLLVTFWALIVAPTVRTQSRLRDFERLVQVAPHEFGAIESAAREVLAADRLDAGAAQSVVRGALACAQLPQLPPEARLRRLDAVDALGAVALDRSPGAVGAHRLLAQLGEARADAMAALSRTEAAIEARAGAIAHWSAAVRGYPTDPRLRLRTAKALVAQWRITGAESSAEQVVAHLCAALAVDATRPVQAAARLRAGELNEIEALFSELRAANALGPGDPCR